MEISKICPVCHQSFKAKRSTHIYCICKKCKNKVTVINKIDRRTVFCSPHCERLYWKHKKNKDKNLF